MNPFDLYTPPPKIFYTTKIVLEVYVQHQFDPKQAVHLVENLLKVPAVQTIMVNEVQSNYKLHSDPMDHMEEFKY